MTARRSAPRYPINEEFFSTLGPKQAWLIGLFAADGNVKSDRLVSIGQSGDHGLCLIREVQRMLGHDAPVYTRLRAHTITITSPAMVEFLARFNVTPRKSTVYRFPEALPAHLAAPFMRGYIDGDGCVGVYDNGRGFQTLLLSFSGTTAFVERSIGFMPVTMNVRALKRTREMAEARAYGAKALDLGRWLWSDTSLPKYRKQAIFDAYASTSQARYVRYSTPRHEAHRLFAVGMRPMQVARRLGLSCQTVWKWKVKYEARGSS
jgi:hypothetical protein